MEVSGMDLEALADEVMKAHEYRKDRPEHVPMRRKPFKHRPRPNTEPITRAVHRLRALKDDCT